MRHNIYGNGTVYSIYNFMANSNICPICHCLRYIRSGSVQVLDIYLYKEPWSSVNMTIERSYVTSYELANEITGLSVIVCTIFTIEMYDLDL